MTHTRLLALRRLLDEHRAGLCDADAWLLLEGALNELDPLLELLRLIRGPIGDLTEGLEQYEMRKR